MNKSHCNRRVWLAAGTALSAATLLSGLALPRRAHPQVPFGAVPRVTVMQAAELLTSGGWILMMRHEQTVPGVGDPPGFRLDDCSTQRNLSDQGRVRARRAGDVMRSAAIRLSLVRAGRWCRVRETAELAYGPFETWLALDSFFGQSERAPLHRDAVIEFARGFTGAGNAMLVTHQVNITAALEVVTEMGEVVAARFEGGQLRPRLRFVPGSA